MEGSTTSSNSNVNETVGPLEDSQEGTTSSESKNESSRQKTPNRNESAHDIPDMKETVRSVAETIGHTTVYRKLWSCLRHTSDKFPRTTTILFRIVVPLLVLVLIATVFGYVLSQVEGPAEIQYNDEISAKRYLLNSIPVNETVQLLGLLPMWCYIQLLEGTENVSFVIPDPKFPSDDVAIAEARGIVERFQDSTNFFLDDTSRSGVAVTSDVRGNLTELVETAKDVAIEQALSFISSSSSAWVNGSIAFMYECGQRVEKVVRQLLNVRTAITLASSTVELSFNWIRCWNVTDTGPFVVYNPTEEMLEAAVQQGQFYAQVWQLDQRRLFQEYIAELDLSDGTEGVYDLDSLLELPNITEGVDAWLRSIEDATGGGGCSENTSASAWFWFTVMTTVGYGNQAPTSLAGRSMVIWLGIVSILAFGAVLASTGNILQLIVDDIVGRSRLSRFMTWPSVKAIGWGGIAIGWMFVLGSRTSWWWENRLDLETSNHEKFWFGFISSTTVGLGDYFLQPEVLFLQDVIQFSFLFLTGFVFTATFLTSVGSFVVGLFPSSRGSSVLERRLRDTNLLWMGSRRPNEDGAQLDHGNKFDAGPDSSSSLEDTLHKLQNIADKGSQLEDNASDLLLQQEEQILLNRIESIRATLRDEADAEEDPKVYTS